MARILVRLFWSGMATMAGTLIAGAAMAQEPAAAAALSEPLKVRIAELVPMLKGDGDYEAYFAPGFVAQIPKTKFEEVGAQLVEALGPVERIESITAAGANRAMLTVGFRDGTASMAISVSETPPHQVDGLLVTGTSGRERSIPEIVDKLRALPGSTAFALAKLGAKPQMVTAHNADQPLAIGSAFKLVILAELVRSINAGDRRWGDQVTLDGSPLPGGVYTQMPKGAQVTLEELAGKMISVSDNSATDILLHFLGRDRVEAMLPLVGIARPEGMRPFLSTLELFKLKGVKGGLGALYGRSDEAARRALIAGELAKQPISAISSDIFQDGKPIMIDTLEWFASASDLVRVMDWLRRNSEGNAIARTILAKNPGIGSATKWRYVGYKGGSEPGVINMTLLMQDKKGDWYALAATWNNPAAAIDQARFAGLISRAAELAAPAP